MQLTDGLISKSKINKILLLIALSSCKQPKAVDNSLEAKSLSGLQYSLSAEELAIQEYLVQNGSEDMVSSAFAARNEMSTGDFPGVNDDRFALSTSAPETVFALCAKAQYSLLISGQGGGICINLKNPLKKGYRLKLKSHGFTTELASASAGLLVFQDSGQELEYNHGQSFLMPFGGIGNVDSKIPISLKSLKINISKVPILSKMLQGISRLSSAKANKIFQFLSPVNFQSAAGPGVDLLYLSNDQDNMGIFVGIAVRAGSPITIDLSGITMLITPMTR